MKGYETLTEWNNMDELVFDEPHVTGGVARIHIKVYQILQFMDNIYANRGKHVEKPSDDVLVAEFISNHGAYRRRRSSAVVPTKGWAETIREYWESHARSN